MVGEGLAFYTYVNLNEFDVIDITSGKNRYKFDCFKTFLTKIRNETIIYAEINQIDITNGGNRCFCFLGFTLLIVRLWFVHARIGLVTPSNRCQ